MDDRKMPPDSEPVFEEARRLYERPTIIPEPARIGHGMFTGLHAAFKDVSERVQAYYRANPDEFDFVPNLPGAAT